LNQIQDEFRNNTVAAVDLPDFSAVELNPVARSFAPYTMITGSVSVLFFCLLGLIVSTFVWDLRIGFYLSGLIALLIPLTLVHGFFDARYRGWALREHDLISSYGVLWRRTVILPLARIQHVETASGPIERLFGLMRLQCFSAGGASADMVVEGLAPQTALRIRSHILEHIRDDERRSPERTPDQKDDSGE